MDDRFLKGIEEFNRHFFFEAHDIWEDLWMDTTGNHRLFYQGLIQTAVGFYHLSNRNFRGACSQFTKARTKLEQYLPQFHGIETGMLVTALGRCLREAEVLRDDDGGEFEDRKIPQIHFVFD